MADQITTKTFQIELVSPEQLLASEEATMVVIPGEAGDFGVLADHAPLLSSIRPGVVTITSPDGSVKRLFVAGGFADVSGKTCSVLAEEAVNVNDLDKTKLDEALKNLQDDLGFSADDVVKKARVLNDIEITKAKIAAIAA